MVIIDGERVSEFPLPALTNHQRRSSVVLERESVFGVANQSTWLTDQIFTIVPGACETSIVPLGVGYEQKPVECAICLNRTLLALCVAFRKKCLHFLVGVRQIFLRRT